MLAELRQVGLPAASPFGLPGVSSMPLTQVSDSLRSLFTPSTLSGGLMNSCVVSVMVPREIGLAKMLDCEMCPRLCAHCTKAPGAEYMNGTQGNGSAWS